MVCVSIGHHIIASIDLLVLFQVRLQTCKHPLSLFRRKENIIDLLCEVKIYYSRYQIDTSPKINTESNVKLKVILMEQLNWGFQN